MTNMSKNIEQIYVDNPITTNADTDLMYFGQSPYGVGDDAAMTYGNFKTQSNNIYLQKSNNLSDVSDSQTAFTNIGLGSGELLNLDTFDFPGGVYALTN